MKITRLDLDGVGSPGGLATRIFEIERDLPIPVPLEELCERLDIVSIGELETEGFEAALITDEVKSSGAILVARGRSRQRRRYSVGHELGHFLIPTHHPPKGEPLLCSDEHMRLRDAMDQDRRRRMETEANRFAACLLMPPAVLREELRKIRQPDVTDIVRLAELFDVSKDAMAISYVEHSRQRVAVIVARNGRVLRSYRDPDTFPWIDVSNGQAVPTGSIYHDGWAAGAVSDVEECEPELWLSERDARKVDILTEQVLGRRNGYSLTLLCAELKDEDDDEAGEWSPSW